MVIDPDGAALSCAARDIAEILCARRLGAIAE